MGGAPSRILENLWLGGADVLDDFEAFAREKGIDAVVSLGEETVRAGIPKLHLDEQDTPETDLRRHFNAIVNFIHDHRCRGLGVYVHCHAGVSRSGAAAAAYLVAWLDLGVRDALGHLMRCRDTVLPNPGFRDQLLDFADDPATGSLRDQLRRTRGPLLAEDLTDVARELEASRDRVETTRKSEWLYEFSKERTRRGGRESKVLENGARCYEPDTTTVAPGMLCILDDQPEAWKPFLRPFVARIEPYRVDQPIETREALAASMRYLGDLAADLLPQLRARGVVWPLPPRWTRSG